MDAWPICQPHDNSLSVPWGLPVIASARVMVRRGMYGMDTRKFEIQKSINLNASNEALDI